MSTVAVVVVLLLLVAAVVLLSYNRLVTLRNRALAAEADIDVQLSRRRDLIPNLVETVQGYAAHERETFEALTAARTAAVNAADSDQRALAEADVARCLDRVFAVAEAYPDLQADKRFAELHDELVATENKLAFSRQLYNDTATAYRRRIESLPTALFARRLGFEPLPLYAARGDERDPVTVRLASEQP